MKQILSLSSLLILLLFAFQSCNEAAETPSEDLSATEVDTLDAFDCPFDESNQDDAFMKELDHFVHYTWIDSAKMAVVPLANKDTLFITRGGCLNFNFFAELHTSVTEPVINDIPFWFERGLALAQSFLPEEETKKLKALMDSQSYSLDATNNQMFVTFEQDEHCEMTMVVFLNQKREHNIMLEIGYSDC